MVVSQDRGRWVAGSSGVSLVRIGASSGAGVVLQEYIDDDFVHRFRACAAASDAIWHQGWLGCRTDGERGAWVEHYVEHYADYLEDRLDA